MMESTSENARLLYPAIPSQSYGSQSENVPVNNTIMTTTRYKQYIAALSATGGALAAGTILGWTSPVQPRLDEYDFPISNEEFSWVGSTMTLGGAFVCIPIGILINIFGRKLTMLLLVIPFTIAWLLLICAQNVAMMYIARFLLGIAGGAFCICAPVYTGEIAEKEIRGTLGSYFQLMITIGILFVYAVGSGVSVLVLSIICGTIPLIFCVIFFFMPESPHYLVFKNKEEDASKSLKWLRGASFDPSSEIAALHALHAEIKANPVSISAAMKRPANIRALVISIGLMFFQQMSGINAVIFYTSDIFGAADTSISASNATIIVGVMQVIATFISSLIVDKLGRRILLLASASVMALCTILLGVYFSMKDNDNDSVSNIAWLPIASLCIFIIMFSLGFGPIPWLMIGELFAPDIKGFSSSISGTVNWLLAFIVTKTFTNLRDAIGIGPTFWLFSALSILGTIFVFFVVPETKGKSLQEIQDLLEKDSGNTQASANKY